MYFYYRKTFTGIWSPVKSTREPRKKTADGFQHLPTSYAVKLTPKEHHLSLAQLSELYPIEEAA